MQHIIDQVMVLLPVIAAINVCLSAIGALADAIAKVQGQTEPTKIGKVLGMIAAAVKKLVDLMTANLPHK